MVHAYAGEDAASSRAAVYEPLRGYLRSFFAQQRDAALELGDEAEIAAQIDFATERYISHAALIGTLDHCRAIVEKLRACGVDEIACLIDFGVSREATLASLERLGELVAAYAAEERPDSAVAPVGIDQARLVELELRDPSGGGNHVAGGLLISAAPDHGALERALRRLAERHESARSRFRRGPGGIERVVTAGATIPLVAEDGRAAVGLDRDALRARLTAFAREPFELERGPLMRALALRTAEAEFALALVMHHAVTDWVASGVLFEELLAAYRAELGASDPAALAAPGASAAEPLPAESSFSAFARWERGDAARALFAANTAYFADLLAGTGEPVTIPPDLSPPARRGYGARRVWFVLDEATAKAADALARQTRCTPYAVFLGAYNALLARLTGRGEIVVGTPSANRETPAFARTVGLLMSMMPLVTRVEPGQTFRDRGRAGARDDDRRAGAPERALPRPDRGRPAERAVRAPAALPGPLPVPQLARAAQRRRAARGGGGRRPLRDVLRLHDGPVGRAARLLRAHRVRRRAVLGRARWAGCWRPSARSPRPGCATPTGPWPSCRCATGPPTR